MTGIDSSTQKDEEKKLYIIYPNVSIFRFCYLQSCGCVFSDRAMKEVKTEICHKVFHIFPNHSISTFFVGLMVCQAFFHPGHFNGFLILPFHKVLSVADL